MPPRPFVPEELRHRPFSQSEALATGLTAYMLSGPTWVRLFPRVWVHRDHVMTDAGWIAAAALAMPARAQLSHVSRIQALGLDIGAVWPVHFTIAGDLHIAMENVFLHRTEILPPLDATGVTPAAAFIQFCATARLIDAIKVGDWLLHRRHVTILEVTELSRRDHWRPGAQQVRRVVRRLDAGSRSLPESEVRVLLAFAGLPVPEVNVPIVVDGELLGVVDLLIRAVMLALEYEGRQHAESITQFNRDIGRYAAFRRNGVEYLQVTKEMTEKPKVMVRRVHARMVELGYDGPSPVFGPLWDSLFEVIPTGPVRQPPFPIGKGDSATAPRPYRRPGHRPAAG
ncbi:MAG: hypothetical protein ABW075_09695 [Aeromicrobium sp.]